MTTRTIKGVLDESAADGCIGADDHLALRTELDALVADANRYRAQRLIMTEPDPNLKAQFFHCVDHQTAELMEATTPDAIDAAYDEIGAACQRVRDANG